MKDRLILVTNDDGYSAKGIAALARAASKFGRVVVVAPQTPQSGMSQAITMHLPLYAQSQSSTIESVEIYSFTGTPVDCVKYALDHLLLGQKVDLVVSGINHGSNAAVNVLYSGTMGAAIEGHFYTKAVGFSLLDHDENADFTASEHYAEQIIGKVLEDKSEGRFCLNVNIPKGGIEDIKGIKLCRQNRGYWQEEFYPRQDPRGNEYFWLTGAFVNEEPFSEDTDEYALAHGYISVVPIQVDMTDYSRLKQLDYLL